MKFFLAVCLLFASAINADDVVLPAIFDNEVVVHKQYHSGLLFPLTPQFKIQQHTEWATIKVDQLKQLLNQLTEKTTTTIVNTLTTGTVEQIVTFVQTNIVSFSDWEFVFNKLYKNEVQWTKVLTVGSSLKFGSNKFVYYAALLNFLEAHKTDDKVAEVFATRHTHVFPHFNYDVVIKYNPIFTFLKFEQELLTEFELIIVDALVHNQLVNHPLLSQVQWNVIWQLYHEKFQHVDFPLQTVLNQSVIEHWHLVNLTNVISQLESIPSDTENHQIQKLQFYVALFNAAHINIRSEVEDYLLLVLSFEDFVKGLPWGTDNTQTITNVQNSYHGCAKFVIKETQNQLYSIQNRYFKEYLYTVVPEPSKTEKPNGWLTTPKDFTTSTYRPAFTWRKESVQTTFKGQFQWYVEHANRRFWIRNGEYSNLYLDTTHSTYVHLTKADSKLPRLAVWFVPSPLDHNACYIRNYETRHTVYAGEDVTAEDEKRRTVFSNGSCNVRASLWYVKDFQNDILTFN